VSPATPFSDASLPNPTKMFELVHVVTFMDDFAGWMPVRPTTRFSSANLICYM
jgi:hypothetical protein